MMTQPPPPRRDPFADLDEEALDAVWSDMQQKRDPGKSSHALLQAMRRFHELIQRNRK